MIFGLVVRNCLRAASLPVDAGHLQLAKNECNKIVQDLWYRTKADYRQSRGQITTVSGADEYVLNRFFDGFVPNTLQGPSSNPRFAQYIAPVEFFKKIQLQQSSSGKPFIYTFGEMVGFDAQLTQSEKVKVYSLLASKTSGTIDFVNGSDIIKASASIFTLNDVGRNVRKSGDTACYKIERIISPTKAQLAEKYRGVSQDGADHEIGDIGIHVNIQGFVGGQIDSEDVELNGSNTVTTLKTFTSITSISKSDVTGGNILVKGATSNQTLATFAPAETEIERQTVVLWPKPDTSEVLKYRFFMKHPRLWLDSDRFLIPEKWHRLIESRLELKLKEIAEISIAPTLSLEIQRMEKDFEDQSEDLSGTRLVPEDDDGSLMGDQFYYDKFY